MTDHLTETARKAFEASCPDVTGAQFSYVSEDWGDFGRGMSITMTADIAGQSVLHGTTVRFSKTDTPERMAELCGRALADWAKLRIKGMGAA
ncbi:MAG: hypothetical protein HC889_12650 [Synechococcaceae cyanobacterium SM1_2_3]|nr:hypothetical protein [Synechococcaceae cyanobacterium SM1_2_3]